MKKPNVTKLFALPALLLLLAVSALALPAAADAATAYQEIPYDGSVKKIGSCYFKHDINYQNNNFYYSTSGSNFKLIGESDSVLTNGTYVIFIKTVDKGSYKQEQLVLFSTKTGKAKVLKTLPGTKDTGSNEPDYFNLDLVCGNVVYLTRASFEKWGYWEYTYNLKTGKWAKALSNGHISGYSGKTAIINHDYRTDVSPCKISIYSFNSSGKMKKIKTLGKNCSGATITGKRIYYGVYTSGVNKMKLYSCTLKGTGKKLLGTFEAGEYGFVVAFDFSTSKCKVMIDDKTYDYTYSTKKLEEITEQG